METFSLTQWETLLSIADTFYPALTASEIAKIKAETLPTLSYGAENWTETENFLTTSATSDPDFPNYLAYYFVHNVPPTGVAETAGLLDILDGGIKTYNFCSTTTPFRLLPLDQRDAILKGWKDAYTPLFCTVFNSFRAITAIVYLRTSKAAFAAVGYPTIDPCKISAADLASRNLPKFAFEGFGGAETAEVEVDVVVIGSGSGGQVVATKLAQKGLKVLVVDKGRFFPQEQLPLPEIKASGWMFENGGVVVTSDGRC